MRLLTWNCCGGLTRKLPALLELGVDVAVVPEGTLLDVSLLRDLGLSLVSKQPTAGGPKHLVVLARDPWRAEPLDVAVAREMPWVLPVAVTGPVDFTVVAVWAQTAPPAYTIQNARVVDDVLPDLPGPVVVAGDLNAPGRDGSPSLRAHLRTVESLAGRGLVSAYAVARGTTPALAHADEPGGTSPALREPTYYHRRRRDDVWHLDHVFVPRDWTPGLVTTVGAYDAWVAAGLSDHVPVIVDVIPRVGQ